MRAYRTYCLTLLILAFTTSATAQSKPLLTPWIGATAGFGTYAMGDVNEDIRNVDALIFAKFDEINSGFAFGADAGFDVNQQWRIGVHYSRLLAGSDVGDASGTLDYNLPANAVYGSVDFLPPMASLVKVGLGVSGGVVLAAGTVDLSVAGVGTVSGELSGSGPYFDAHVSLDLPLGTLVALTPVIGYRYANVTEVELDDQPVYTDSGEKYDVDYSGFLLRVGLRIMLSSSP